MGNREQQLNSFEQDVFNRKIIAENLTKIIEGQEGSLVMSLDSEWGTGKTTFVNMWKNMLDSDGYNDKFETIYFNAWENDYIKDPLVALFAELEEQINEGKGELKKNFKKVKSVMIPLVKSVSKIGIKLATAGVVDFDKIPLGDKLEDALIDASKDIGDLIIKDVKASKDIRNEFKKVMGQFQKEINKKIVFFIDELDRCRPTFSIELLEVIKHLFDIDNCIFVISIDKEQLSHSVSTIYGSNMDTIGYLRRFFDLDYKLPKIKLKEYADFKSKSIFNNIINIDMFKVFIEEKFINEKFSLRDIDKAYYYIKLLLPLIKEFNVKRNYKSMYIVTISYLYATLITLKIKNPVLYKKVIEGDYTVDEVSSKFKTIDLEHYKNNVIGEWDASYLNSVIKTIGTPFLTLNLKSLKEEYIINDGEQYKVGVNNEDSLYDRSLTYDLTDLFNHKQNNIINKLEFIDSFQIK